MRKRYQVNEAKVAWRVVEGEGVLLHLVTSAYYGLNRLGTLMWERVVAGPVSSDELSAWTAEATGVPPSAIAGDMTAFLEQLRAADLLDEVAGGAAPCDAPPLPKGLVYEAPQLLPFGELEKLILSGE